MSRAIHNSGSFSLLIPRRMEEGKKLSKVFPLKWETQLFAREKLEAIENGKIFSLIQLIKSKLQRFLFILPRDFCRRSSKETIKTRRNGKLRLPTSPSSTVVSLFVHWASGERKENDKSSLGFNEKIPRQVKVFLCSASQSDLNRDKHSG